MTFGTDIGVIRLPTAEEFASAKSGEPQCLLFDGEKTYVALRPVTLFPDTYLYTARPVDSFSVEIPDPGQADRDALRRLRPSSHVDLDRVRHDVRLDRADHAAVGDLARPVLRQPAGSIRFAA